MAKRKAHTRYTNANGIVVPSVTTVIGNNLGWNKNVLIAWSISQCKKGLDPNKTRDTAADIGTLTHKYIQCYIYGAENDDEIVALKENATMEQVVIAERGLNEFKEWMKENTIDVIESECGFVSEEFQYGGTVDLVVKKNGVLCLPDIKTSSGIWPENFIQLSAYSHGLKEKYGYEFDEYGIIKIRKDFDEANEGKPIIEFHQVTKEQIRDGFEAFKHLRGLHDFAKKLKVKEEKD